MELFQPFFNFYTPLTYWISGEEKLSLYRVYFFLLNPDSAIADLKPRGAYAALVR